MREIKFRAWENSGKYVAGSDGLVYSTDFNHTGKMKALKGVFDKDGYHHVLLNIDGKRLHRSTHKLVALAFLGARPLKMVINHKNGKRTDNRPENLEYVTSSYNAIHAWKRGRQVTEKQREQGRKLATMINKKRWNYEKV